VGVVGVTRAHVSETVEHAQTGKDAVGGDQIVEQSGGCEHRNVDYARMWPGHNVAVRWWLPGLVMSLS
jgi:hypothetical protein